MEGRADEAAVGERRVVTVLFADIGVSTKALTDHDAESVRSTFGLVFERMRSLIESHGGVVEKYIGDAVMAVFGAPIAHDDDAERAVRAAVAMHELVESKSASLPFPIRLRIGINTGEVITAPTPRHDLLVTGLAVNVAARLFPAAELGTTLVGPATRALTERAVEYAPPTEIAGKGTGPISASRVVAVTGAPGATKRDDATLRAPLIDRDAELDSLRQELERARRDGRARLVTILGDAGVGKSRLMREFAASTDALLLLGRCLAYGDAAAHHAARSIVLAAGGVTDVAATAEAVSERIASIVPGADAQPVAARVLALAGFVDPAEALPQVRAEELALELRWGFCKLLEHVAPSRSLLLVVEDVHWAAADLHDLNEDVAARCARPLLVCCLARPEFIDGRPGWGAQGAHASTLRLAPLEASRTRELVVELLRVARLPEGLVAEIADRSGGNPLYVEEILRALIASGELRHDDDGWEAAATGGHSGVPESLRGIITARLDRLGAPARVVLQTGAVLGRYFSLDGVRALGDDGAPLAAAVQEAVRREFIVLPERATGGPARYWFRHALIRDAVYLSIPKRRRRMLHERAAAWLQERDPDSAEQSVHHLEQAFALACDLGDQDAATLGRRAYEALVAAADRHRLRGGLRASAAAAYERAAVVAERLGLSDDERRHELAWAAVADHFPRHGDFDQTPLLGALKRVRDLGPTTGLAELLGLASFHQPEPAARRSMAEESLAVARSTGDPNAIGWGLWWVRAHADPADHELNRSLLEQILEHARANKITSLFAMARIALAERAIYSGSFSRALDLLTEARAIGTVELATVPMAASTIDLASVHAYVHDREPVIPYVDEAIATMRKTMNMPFVADVLWQAASIEHQIGELERACEHGEEALRSVDARVARASIGAAHYNLALAYADLGRLELARHHIDAFASLMSIDTRKDLLPGSSGVFWLYACGVVAAAAGDDRDAERRFRQALASMEQRAVIQIWGESAGWDHMRAQASERLATILARDGRVAEARILFGSALAFWQDPLAWRRRAEIDAKVAALPR